MPFAPVIPTTGLSGWNFLQRTLSRQSEIFNSSPDIKRDITYFKENIGNISSLEEFVGDRRILKVALGAFGLDGEIDKRAFVRKILEEGTTDTTSFARRLNDPNYLQLAEVFSFGDGGFTATDSIIDDVVKRYEDEQFEIALGKVDPSQRLALNFERNITQIAEKDLTDEGGWFAVLASRPLREVIEDVFNLPESFSQIDLDQQVSYLQDRSLRLFGDSSVKVFLEPKNVEKAINRFHLIQQLNSGPSASTPGATAITLLSGGLGAEGFANLLLSNS